MQTSYSRNAAALLAALALGAVAGCGNGQTSTPASAPMSGMDHAGTNTADVGSMEHDGTAPREAMAEGMTPLVAGADGTAASAGGLTLTASPASLTPGRTVELTLQVTGKDGMPITEFERDQTKLMHLVIARDDFADFQHLHPTLHPATGKFTIAATLPKPGHYRAIADFSTAGKRYALGVDLAAGAKPTSEPQSLPPASPDATTDGYEVALKHAALTAGSDAALTFQIMRNGQPVTALQPYLGAAGHLVALRAGDLAYLHVHPVSADGAAGKITFNADLPTAASYRLFLQFRTAGAVHTAAFTVTARK
jgi:hypothetical protein